MIAPFCNKSIKEKDMPTARPTYLLQLNTITFPE